MVITPTNYDSGSNRFDTSSADSEVSGDLKLNSDVLAVFISTIRVGHTRSLQERHNVGRVVLSSERMGEGHALKDNLYPSSIIMRSQLDAAKSVCEDLD